MLTASEYLVTLIDKVTALELENAVLTKQNENLTSALNSAWSLARRCTGQMHRSAALTTDWVQQRDLRYVANDCDSKLEVLFMTTSARRV